MADLGAAEGLRAGLAFPRETQNQVEWLVLWQRVGAGFSAGQQRELAQRVSGQLGLGQRKAPRVNPQIEREAGGCSPRSSGSTRGSAPDTATSSSNASAASRGMPAGSGRSAGSALVSRSTVR